jgi:predicted nuclease with TOPRIM domain
MHLWSEDDMLNFAILARGVKSRSIRRDIKACIKEHARRDMVSREEYIKMENKLSESDAVKKSLEERLADMDARLRRMEELQVEWSSLSGKTLREQRELKALKN